MIQPDTTFISRMHFIECICSTRDSRASISRERAEIDWSAYRCVALAAGFSGGQPDTVLKLPDFLRQRWRRIKTPKPALRNATSFNFAWNCHIGYSWYAIPIAPSAGQPLGKNFNEKVLKYFSKHRFRTKRDHVSVALFVSKCTFDYVAGMSGSPVKTNSDNIEELIFRVLVFLFVNFSSIIWTSIILSHSWFINKNYCVSYDFLITIF